MVDQQCIKLAHHIKKKMMAYIGTERLSIIVVNFLIKFLSICKR